MAARETDFFDGLDEARAESGAPQAMGGADSWRLLRELTDLLNSPIDRFEQVLERSLETAIRVAGADRGLLILLDRRGSLEVRLARGRGGAAGAEPSAQVSQSIVQEVLRTRRGVAIADLGATDRFGDSASIHELKLLSVMCVPLVQRLGPRSSGAGADQRAGANGPRDKVLGALYVDSRSVGTSFGSAELDLFQAVANVATTAIVHASDFRRATVDELTGLASRRYLERRLDDEIALVRRSADGRLAALLLDIDGLRDVNHEQGYGAGDRIIQAVGRVLLRRTRLFDICGRYGGEEFLVVLPETGLAGAEEVARKLLVSLQREGVTVSVGIAAWRRGDELAGELVRRAAQALGQAKAEGGGRARTFADGLVDREPATDRLDGLFSGEAATVYRNILLLLESVPRIHRAGSVDRVLECVLDRVIDLARAERGYLVLETSAGPVVSLGYDWRRRTVPADGVDLDLVARVLDAGGPVSIAERAGHPAVLCVPLGAQPRGGGRAIYLEARGEAFREGVFAFVVELAHQAGIAVENARLLDENRAYGRKVEKLMRALESEREAVTKARDLEARSRDATAAAGADGEGAVSAAEEGGSSGAAAEAARSPRRGYDRILGESKAMQAVYHLLDRVTRAHVPVFIYGESGTGKELAARAIHFNGPRRKARFVAENCAAMSETLLESELFGYVRGAFTGANTDREGLFELASGGTLFLDEVGDMTAAMQTKLLRVLQEGEIRRVGGKDLIKVDVRVVSASNKDIQRMVEEGRFREDLYYRLNVVRVDLPPLRERAGDIRILVDHFLRDDGRLEVPRKRMSEAASEMLLRYPFPGNIRELRNVIERAKILAEGPEIGPEAILLDADVVATTPVPLAPRPAAAAQPAPTRGEAVEPAPARGASALLDRPDGVQVPATPVPPGSRLEGCYFELNERQRKLVEYLQTFGSIRNRDYYEIMGVSKSTGWRDLKGLIQRHLIRVAGKGKGSVYSLDPDAATPGSKG